MQVDFNDPSMFTDVYWKIQDATKRFVVSYGGAGSSKSYSHHQHELMNLLDADYDILVLRKHGSDIYDSCFALFIQIAESWGVKHLFKWNFSNAKREIVNITSGHRIIFRGIDDPEKVKSIVGIKRILYEEASQGTFDDFLELNRRARGIEGIQFTFLLNPVSENNWVKRQLIDSGKYDDKLDVIISTYKDNPFMTDDDIDELERLKLIDENQYRIYVLAEWGVDDKSGKFAYAFERDKHVGWCEHDPDIMTILSFDFNVNPITCVVVQQTPTHDNFVECIKLNDSNIYALCDVIRAKYPHAVFMVTGDASGTNNSALTKDKINYYTIIKEQLNLGDGQFKVPSVNPPLVENRVLVNAYLNNAPCIINEDSNDGLIYDLLYVEVDENNKIKKDVRTDKKQQADALDCFRYYINTFRREYLMRPMSYKSPTE